MIHRPVESEPHAYLGGVCNKMNSPAFKAGGYTDHVHIPGMLSKKIALMKLMEQMKVHSSKWIKSKGKNYECYYWQDGYVAFSVKPSDVNLGVTYIENQHNHHSRISFQHEYRSKLKKYNINYDERYV